MRIVFESGHELDDGDRAMLREGCSLMAARSDILRIRVMGYRYFAREPDAALGLQRAQAVADFFVNECGFSRERLEVVDMGEDNAVSGAMDTVVLQRVEFAIQVRRRR